jgi:Protein of unknown function (DUF3306)
MANPTDDGIRSDGFLSRWARRKQDVLAGKPVAEPALPQKAASPVIGLPQAAVLERNQPVDQQNSAQAATETIANVQPTETHAESQADAPPALTLDDASALTPASDFKPFMARSVSPEVKNAAMKKLFADPHYNIMDMMDTYVDDYSKPDPIPESMLRQLASAKFLRLFERDEEETQKEEQGGAKPGQALAADQALLPSDNVAQEATPTPLQAEPAPLAAQTSHPDLLQAPIASPVQTLAQPLTQPIPKTL